MKQAVLESRSRQGSAQSSMKIYLSYALYPMPIFKTVHLNLQYNLNYQIPKTNTLLS
ncbi:hypothetical protein FDUTEX481_05469 [Tolypothrix sp. PCC 7601]|nr:hypothetical protein FDUTEX481_05469 [Tolypothrix sp. PCC 7601]BAY88897.1 hypothetical protein NIES3275_08970 [Microchaete diplosiphon NIES-3275]